jgi:hypothetical protein
MRQFKLAARGSGLNMLLEAVCVVLFKALQLLTMRCAAQQPELAAVWAEVER